MLVVRILPWTRFFCNVHLFRVPQGWTGSFQMKSSMTFIRGNRCIERERKIIIPLATKLGGGGILESPCPSVCLSVRRPSVDARAVR